MKKFSILVALSVLFVSCAKKVEDAPRTLKSLFPENILVGVAINQWHVQKGLALQCDSDIAAPQVEVDAIPVHFNAVTAENCMKSEVLNPAKGVFDFTLADQFVEYAAKNDMAVFGHSPIWHSQQARWFCFEDDGTTLVSADTLKQRIHDHIFAVMTRYKGKIKGYDVVNEALEDDGSWRNSLMNMIMPDGEWVDWSFQCAQEADPDAELYYNDYSMFKEGKRQAVCDLVRRLQSKGIRIDAVGLQCHYGMDFPEVEEFTASVDSFINVGMRVQFTEFDMSILPNPYQGADVETRFEYAPEKDPFVDGVPDDKMEEWKARMRQFLDVIIARADKTNRITFWGVSDSTSWKNDFPIQGRKDYPLPIDRQGNLKF
ncbi:MAG: endo-1,4-beta-xylanase [Marinilabiliaceae bacterium]|nr:endo-1,4-beta-xylanase [Marinilabiliaceae bacterium]